MAHSGPGTASCQFFITDAEVRRLDGQYTIFGQVVEGMEVVHAIASTTRDGSDRPLTPVRMKVTIERIE
jgi:cyclophilin family peptidyl-prolyl cis-trans isomerase